MSKEYLFFLRAHLSWSGGGFICLILFFFIDGHYLNISQPIIFWPIAAVIYFFGIILFINCWAYLERKFDSKQYKVIVKILPEVIVFGSYLQKAIAVK